MATWQLAVLLLALVWALQSVGVWMQMRHYREALGDIEQRFNSGFVGTGFVRGRLAKGTIALVVISDTLMVDRVAIMAGRSVFAKFQARHEFDGLTLDALRTRAAELAAPGKFKSDKSLGGALAKAIEQIDAVRAKKQQQTEIIKADASTTRPADEAVRGPMAAATA